MDKGNKFLPGALLSNLLIFNTDKELLDYFDYLLSSCGEHEVTLCDDIDQMIAILGDSERTPDLAVVSGLEKETFVRIQDEIEKRQLRLPVIVTCNPAQVSRIKKTLGSHPLREVFDHKVNLVTIMDKIDKMLGMKERKRRDTNYCKINADFFSNAKQLDCDVYLKLSDAKFVKIFERNQEIDHEEFEHYKAKSSQFYLREVDFQKVINQLSERLDSLFSAENSSNLPAMPTKLVERMPIQLRDTVQETVLKLGLTDSVVSMVGHALNVTLDLIDSNPNLVELLKRNLAGKSYISEMSFAISFISCSVVSKTAWRGDQANAKLSLASFFHDMAIVDDESAKIMCPKSNEFEELDSDQQKSVKNHSLKAIDLLKGIDGIPSDVERIVQQHHEKANGTGFPRGIDYKQISPLSAVFILSQELAFYVVEGSVETDQIVDIIAEFKESYYQGNFKQVIDAMEKVFGSSTTPMQIPA